MRDLRAEPSCVLSRRGFLFSLSAAAFAADLTGKGRIFRAPAAAYLDPATEFPIIRFTDPQFTSYFPAFGNRILTSRTLLYTSDSTGKQQAYRLDVRTRETRQITDAADLDITSLAFLPGDKSFLYFDSGQLFETDLAKFKSREIYRAPAAAQKMPGFSCSDDGQAAAFVEKIGERYSLRLVNKGTASTLLESPTEIRDVFLRPRHASVLYRLNDQLWITNFDAQGARRIDLAPGDTGQLQWTADGSALLYLNRPPDAHALTNLRSYSPETNENSPIGNTTQYVHFEANTDASVFVGASGSKASPYVLLLVRAVKREMTLAEHHASDASMVTPLFSPNSQFVVFISDRHGKPAIYWMSVEKFVAATEGN